MSPDALHPDPFRIRDIAALAALYGEPGETSVAKEADRLPPVYPAIVEAAPFAVLATSGPEGFDASPRGDAGRERNLADRELPERVKSSLY